MNISCDIIKDLLPLYHDGVCSEESRNIIEEHLKDCDDCKNYLENINKEISNYNNAPKEEQVKINILKKLRKKFFRKITVIPIVSVLCVYALFCGVMWTRDFLNTHHFPIAYSDNMFSPEKYHTAADIIYNSDYPGTHTIIAKIDDNQIIAYIYCSKTIWKNDSIVGGVYSRLDNITSKRECVDMISKIYYFDGDFSKLYDLPDEEFFEATKDAVLIWEK